MNDKNEQVLTDALIDQIENAARAHPDHTPSLLLGLVPGRWV